MGLSLTAYETITPAADIPFPTSRAEWDWVADQSDLVEVFAFDRYPKALDGIPGGRVRHPDSLNCIGGLIYRTAGKVDRTGMTYRGWDQFRGILVETFGAGYFSDLTNFSDSEGVIASVAAKRLAAEFARHPASALPSEWRDAYARVARVFELASRGGCVKFH